jgi:MFS family permease
MTTDRNASDGGTVAEQETQLKFSSYQKFIVALLAFLQFSIILDFMIISPLGAIIMPDLEIGPQRFGEIVSAYAFSAGISGIVAAGFADRFDRKRFLLFFYFGFMIGTALCALAPNYHLRFEVGIGESRGEGFEMPGSMATSGHVAQLPRTPSAMRAAHRRPAMKSFITAMVLIFTFASGLSTAALTGHDHTRFAQNGTHAAGNQQTVLLY